MKHKTNKKNGKKIGTKYCFRYKDFTHNFMPHEVK